MFMRYLGGGIGHAGQVVSHIHWKVAYGASDDGAPGEEREYDEPEAMEGFTGDNVEVQVDSDEELEEFDDSDDGEGSDAEF